MFMEITPIYSENHMKSKNTQRCHNAELLTVKPRGTCSYHVAVKG